MLARDTSTEIAAIQLDVYRRMTPEARLRVALELTEMSRKLLADGIRARHPEYSNEQVRLAMIRAWLSPDLYRKAYPGYPEIDP